MTDLDSKLRGILVPDSRLESWSGDPRALQEIWVTKSIAAIKQAFEDEGWRQSTIAPEGKYGPFHTFDGKELMTGQEWYDRFEKELLNFAKIKHRITDDVLNIAKKASNLDA